MFTKHVSCIGVITNKVLSSYCHCIQMHIGLVYLGNTTIWLGKSILQMLKSILQMLLVCKSEDAKNHKIHGRAVLTVIDDMFASYIVRYGSVLW